MLYHCYITVILTVIWLLYNSYNIISFYNSYITLSYITVIIVGCDNSWYHAQPHPIIVYYNCYITVIIGVIWQLYNCYITVI